MSVDNRGTEIGEWERLPDVCLLHIFKYLPDYDRSKAALVCHHWHNMMRLPCLWRYRSFYFTGRVSRYKQSEYNVAVGYAKNLGVFLESLKVTVSPPQSVALAERLILTICGLLVTLVRVKAQLKSLSIERLQLDRSAWGQGLRNNLVDNLIFFLSAGSSRLKVICLNKIQISIPQGLNLLSAIIQNQSRLYPLCSLYSLDLRSFFSVTVPNHIIPKMYSMLQELRGLSHLYLSYSCLSDDLLRSLSQSNREKRSSRGRGGNILQSLSLYCSRNEPHQQVVCGYLWANLVSNCLDLKVSITVDQIMDTQQLARILLPDIPLVAFSMTAFYTVDPNTSAKPLLHNLLPCYRHSLQNLKLDLNNQSETLDDELVALVDVCECLVDLSVWAFLDVLTVGRVLQIRLTKRMSLNNIRMTILTMTENIVGKEEQLVEVLSPFSYPPQLKFSAAVCPLT
ncbi:F-box only protein 39-like [Cyprinodon tularosa]|uniref:F-box only protein 39-like n=1 Tax=Cyprinodon tularosa TaxID=77115 RepID=UPI0018E2039C|nr:F-box only protein 39-like [Cyprinodon tularosa]